MLARGLAELRPSFGSVVLIENVGNLVCLALFDLGKRRRIATLSVTEGDAEIPAYVPARGHHAAEQGRPVALSRFRRGPGDGEMPGPSTPTSRRCVFPRAPGEGLEAWYDWLRGQFSEARQAGRV